MSYEISWQDKGITWTFSGVVTGADARQANLDVYGDPRFGNLRYQIVDLSHVEQFDLCEDDMEEAAALDEAASLYNEHLFVAVVAADENARKIATMYQSAMNQAHWTVEVFDTMEDAREWIQSR